MDQNSLPNTSKLVQTTSPEEDTVLLAIEALEARSVDLHPRPLNSPRQGPVPPRPVVVAMPAGPKVMDAVIAPSAPSAPLIPKPIIPKVTVPEPKPVEIKPPHKAVKLAEKPVSPPPAPAPPAKPKKPATPSEEMADELAHAPVSLGFQFFTNQKPPRKPFVIIGIAVVLIGIAVAAYFSIH